MAAFVAKQMVGNKLSAVKGMCTVYIFIYIFSFLLFLRFNDFSIYFDNFLYILCRFDCQKGGLKRGVVDGSEKSQNID